jgi:hypothetical protein
MIGEPPKSFPYYPPTPPEKQLIRMELMKDLNKWENNDPMIAKRCASALIELLQLQFFGDQFKPGGFQTESIKKEEDI